MSSEAKAKLGPEHIRVLIENHARFLAFLRARIAGSPSASQAAAEEILQAAFVKSIEKQDHLRDAESAVAWFYRLLRNALIDHYRRQGTQERALQRFFAETPAGQTELETALESTVCECVNDLIPTLKPEYADVLRRVELEGRPLADVAGELGVTANNAAVRLHRARTALRKRLEQTCGTCTEHGCLDCTCKAGRCDSALPV